ncbi:hypothetical protein [Aquimarina muelleri]|uniref:Alpha-ketoglutarate decarboxylase n=1 Tax=Aquimarina muelleri TaxID=279356 RepID=A0A918JXQ6_9FLAO|nr:hypothetical protein [Aquimarina muelleri]MCX2762416.1 hypothetical protein [Aquimarina muelleri]GGX24696.1 hypothetical protein GCM10007384_27180 [Aquimarina muelleri]
MKVNFYINPKILVLVLIILFSLQKSYSQDNSFWSNVRFGGNLGIGFSNDTFNAVVAPSAIYEFNKWFSAGLGVSFGYSSFDNKRLNQKINSTNYGASIITLLNPFPKLQISAEFEEMGVSRNIKFSDKKITEDYWYPALFIGAGYRVGFMALGIKYDVLYDDKKSIYGSAYTPFLRVYF